MTAETTTRRLDFKRTSRRTMRGPIYSDAAAGYELVQETNRTWYVRDDTGFILTDKALTMADAVADAQDWYEEFGGRDRGRDG